jgi:DNA-binding NarL/FixJ family response regulator
MRARTVLIADDSAMIRKALCRLFTAEQGYDVCAEASNGTEAITLAKKHRPDLIILDYSMPLMNGIEAARKLKEIMPEVPIIRFTNHDAKIRDAVSVLPVQMVVSKSDPNLLNYARSLAPPLPASQ